MKEATYLDNRSKTLSENFPNLVTDTHQKWDRERLVFSYFKIYKLVIQMGGWGNHDSHTREGAETKSKKYFTKQPIKTNPKE